MPCCPGGLGLVAPEWKPLADSSGLRTCGLPPLHQRGKLHSAPAWRPLGLGRHASHQLSLVRCTLHRTLRPSGASLKRLIPSRVLASSASRGLAPREGLELLMLNLGHTRPLMEPRSGPRTGKSQSPRIQNADSIPRAQGALGLGFQAKPRGKCGAPRALTACGLDDTWRLTGHGRLHFPMLPWQLFDLTG